MEKSFIASRTPSPLSGRSQSPPEQTTDKSLGVIDEGESRPVTQKVESHTAFQQGTSRLCQSWDLFLSKCPEPTLP